MSPEGTATETRQIRIFIAEDQCMVRSALAQLIDAEPDLQVVGEAERGDEVLAAVAELRPDVAVLDVDLPGMSGLDACKQIVAGVPGCACLILTALNRPGTLRLALDNGATGFIVKYAPVPELLNAIRTVAAGRRVVDDSLAIAALKAEHGRPTDRELQVMRLLGAGASAKKIASSLHLSEGTVRNYTSNLIRKYDAHNRLDLARIAREEGWI